MKFKSKSQESRFKKSIAQHPRYECYALIDAINENVDESDLFDLYDHLGNYLEQLIREESDIKADLLFSLISANNLQDDKYKKFLLHIIKDLSIDFSSLPITSTFCCPISGWLYKYNLSSFDKSIDDCKKDLSFFIAHGFNLNNNSHSIGSTLLSVESADQWMAASDNQIKALLEMGCDPFLRSELDCSAYDNAVKQGNHDKAALFLYYKDSIDFKKQAQIDMKDIIQDKNSSSKKHKI